MTQKYSEEFIEKHRHINVDHEWWDAVYEDFNRVCEILGIELDKREPSFSGFWSQGDGASWTGRYRANGLNLDTSSGYVAIYDQAPAKMREYAPLDETLHSIADELCLLGRIYHPVYAKIERPYGGNYVHSNTMYVTEWEYYDEEIGFEGVDTEIAHHIEETLIAQFRALADWLYEQLEDEYDHLTSDEVVIETLEANEIEEDEDA